MDLDGKMADSKLYTSDHVLLYLVEVKPSIPMVEDDVNTPSSGASILSDTEDISSYYVDSISALCE